MVVARMNSTPTVAEIFSHFSFDVPWIVAIGLSAWLYLRAAQRLSATNPRVPHPRWKTLCFLGGLLMVGLAVLSPIDHYGRQMLWVNFLSLLILTMYAGPLIVLGSPLTLAFRVSGPAGRQRLRRLYRSPVVWLLTFPVVSGLLFATVTYIWQFSDLTDTATHNTIAHYFQGVTLLLVSLIFWVPALCTDPVRWRVGYPLRVLYVFTEMTHKAFFAAMFLTMSHPVHGDIASHLPSYAPAAMTDQRSAILLLWAGGNLVFLPVIGGLVVRWMQYEGRSTERLDRRLAKANEAARRRRAAMEQIFQKNV